VRGRQRAQLERRRPLGCRLDDDEARPLGHGFEREDDLAAVVLPAQRQLTLGVDLLDAHAPLLAVPPPEGAAAALPRLELDLGREPVLEPFGLGKRLPHLGRLGRKDDLAADVHLNTSSHDALAQPKGCV